MKISKSKRQLAQIIRENGGWRDGVEFCVSTSGGIIIGSKSKPKYTSKYGWIAAGGFIEDRIEVLSCLKNWHQTVLSREEFDQVVAETAVSSEQDADGWIAWNGGECPVGDELTVDVRLRNGEAESDMAYYWNWSHDQCSCRLDRQIIAYRLHSPEQVEAQTDGESPEQRAKLARIYAPTLDQLLQDWRNADDYAQRKQTEADEAAAMRDERWQAVQARAGEMGVTVGRCEPMAAEPEPVITDWRDLMVGDIIECVGNWEGESTDGLQFAVTELEGLSYDGSLPIRIEVHDTSCPATWGGNFKFIRRP